MHAIQSLSFVLSIDFDFGFHRMIGRIEAGRSARARQQRNNYQEKNTGICLHSYLNVVLSFSFISLSLQWAMKFRHIFIHPPRGLQENQREEYGGKACEREGEREKERESKKEKNIYVNFTVHLMPFNLSNSWSMPRWTHNRLVQFCHWNFCCAKLWLGTIEK